MSADRADLGHDIVAAARLALAEARALAGDDLRAMALYSDAGAMTVCQAFDTRTHLAAQVQRYPDDAAYFEFAPDEWGLATPGADPLFTDLSRRVAERLDNLVDRETRFADFREELFETCVRSVEALRADAPDLLLLFDVSDGGHRDQVAWMRRTSPQHADRFATWLEDPAT